jgi:protein gp37
VSAKTSIEWTDRTWNPTRGCTRVSEGCRNCYAERMAGRGFSWSKGFATSTPAGPRWTGKVALIPEALDEPLRWRKPQRVFVNSMSDLFHESLPDEVIDEVFARMAVCQEHTFQVLTKRPERMRAYMDRAFASQPTVRCIGLEREGDMILSTHSQGYASWPLPNVWLGVSVEDQATADERIPLLLQTPAAVRFISLEPQLEAVRPILQWSSCCGKSWPNYLPGSMYERSSTYCPACGYALTVHGAVTGIDWLIVGGESGPGARPFDIAWARSVVRQCKAAGVAVFVKQLGARPVCTAEVSDWVPRFVTNAVSLRDRKGGDPAEWPEDLRIRQFPGAE